MLLVDHSEPQELISQSTRYYSIDDFCPTDLGYTAATIDCDGCVHIGRSGRTSNRYLTVVVVNTNPILCYWLKDTYGGDVAERTPQNAKHKVFYQWRIHSNQAAAFLELIHPYLKLKLPQAALGIAFQKHKDYQPGRLLNAVEQEWRDACAERMAALNRKGR